MIKTHDVHMDPLERINQIITLTEVINDILASNSPPWGERLKALLAILDFAVRDVHFLLEGGEMPGETGATNEQLNQCPSTYVRTSINRASSGCPGCCQSFS